jgi:transcriptional regulator with XRE-family HTH domain
MSRTAQAEHPGTRLRNARAQALLTQTELARRSQVGRRTIIRIERREQFPGLIVQEKLARALGISRHVLFPESVPEEASA